MKDDEQHFPYLYSFYSLIMKPSEPVYYPHKAKDVWKACLVAYTELYYRIMRARPIQEPIGFMDTSAVKVCELSVE